MRLFLVFFLLVFASIFTHSQQKINKKTIDKIEDFILFKNKDSANYYFKKYKGIVYLNQLERLVKSNYTNLSIQNQFLDSLALRFANNYKVVSDFIDETVSVPRHSKEMNNDYVMIRWKQSTHLLNDRFLDEAYRVYEELKNYINQFDEDDVNVAKAKLRIRTYPITIHIIKAEVKKGKDLVINSIEESKELNAIELEILFKKELLHFFLLERDLESYIKTAENTLKIAETLEDKEHYYSLLPNLLNAYIYKGGYEEKTLVFLEDMFNHRQTRGLAYMYYTQFLGTNYRNKELISNVLNKFEVNSTLEYINKVKPISKKLLLDNDFTTFLNYASLALLKIENYEEAFNLKNDALDLTKEIYSKKLSESLANYKALETINETAEELRKQKIKNLIFIGSTVLFFTLLLFTFFVYRKFKKQSIQLAQKNEMVKKTLKEKEILIREVHHRVKNNFQVITSLLTLEQEEIKDNKSLTFIEKCQNRINSMALIHQKLYENKNKLIDFGKYIKTLTEEVACIYKMDKDVKIVVEADNIMLDVDTANPLGLIVNEQITNSFKHAFVKGKSNVLFVSLNQIKKGSYCLTVKDNGKGLPENFNIETLKSSGFKLVKRLIRQLHGKMNISNEDGLKMEIFFKDTQKRKEIQ